MYVLKSTFSYFKFILIFVWLQLLHDFVLLHQLVILY